MCLWLTKRRSFFCAGAIAFLLHLLSVGEVIYVRRGCRRNYGVFLRRYHLLCARIRDISGFFSSEGEKLILRVFYGFLRDYRPSAFFPGLGLSPQISSPLGCRAGVDFCNRKYTGGSLQCPVFVNAPALLRYTAWGVDGQYSLRYAYIVLFLRGLGYTFPCKKN